MKLEQIDKLKYELPNIPNINGRSEYLNSVVLVPLIAMNDEYHLIFQKRSSKIRQAGEICFPGGVYDAKKDADMKHTAIRETFEEMGIDSSKIRIIGRLDTVIAPAGVIVDAFVGVVDIKNMDEVVINPDEVDYAFAVPLSHFEDNNPELYKIRVMVEPSYIDDEGKEIVLLPSKELGLPECYHKPYGKRHSRIYVYKYENEVIWGITSRFIYDFVNKIKKLSTY